MSEPQAARPTQHVSEKALEDLDHNVIEPPPVPRRDIPEGAGKVVFVGAGPGAPDLIELCDSNKEILSHSSQKLIWIDFFKVIETGKDMLSKL